MMHTNKMILANPLSKNFHIGSNQRSNMAFSRDLKFGTNYAEESSFPRMGKIFYQNLIQALQALKGQIDHTSHPLHQKISRHIENDGLILNNGKKPITSLLPEDFDRLSITPANFLAENPEIQKILKEDLAALRASLGRSNFQKSLITDFNLPGNYKQIKGADLNLFINNNQQIQDGDFIRQIISKLSHYSNDIKKSNYKNKGHNFSINLHPKHLGSLHISLKHEENTLQAHFSTENPTTLKMLKQNLAVLKSTLSGLDFQGSPITDIALSLSHHQKHEFDINFPINHDQKQSLNLSGPHCQTKKNDLDLSLTHKQHIQGAKFIQQILPHLSDYIKNSKHKNVSQKNSRHNFTIDLQPEHLGPLDISLKHEDNKLQVHFSAKNPAAQKMLEENLTFLKSSLADLDFQDSPISDINLSVNHHQNHEFDINFSINHDQKPWTDINFSNPHCQTKEPNLDLSITHNQNIQQEKFIQQILPRLSDNIKNIDHKNINLKNNSHNFIIDLYPEHLGSLHISLEHEGQTFKARFSAENPTAQKLLQKNLTVLKSSISKYLNKQIGETDIPQGHKAATNQNEVSVRITSPLPFQSSQTFANEFPSSHHQKQKGKKGVKKELITIVNKENPEDPSSTQTRLFSSQKENDLQISFINPKSNEKQIFSQFPKTTVEFRNLNNKAKKASFTDYSGSIEHSGQVITKENTGLQTPLTKIPLSPEELIQQTLPQLSAHIKNNGHNLIIDLQPEYLGKLHITLEMKENMLKANIMTENPMVQKILEENLALLKASLANQGVQVEHFSVSVGEKGNDQNGRYKFAEHSKKREQKIKSINSSSPGPLSEPEQMGGQNEDNGINYLV